MALGSIQGRESCAMLIRGMGHGVKVSSRAGLMDHHGIMGVHGLTRCDAQRGAQCSPCCIQVVDMTGPEPEVVRRGKGDASVFEA